MPLSSGVKVPQPRRGGRAMATLQQRLAVIMIVTSRHLFCHTGEFCNILLSHWNVNMAEERFNVI